MGCFVIFVCLFLFSVIVKYFYQESWDLKSIKDSISVQEPSMIGEEKQANKQKKQTPQTGIK